MQPDFNRSDRVGSLMQRELANLVRELDGMPPGLVTIQEVRVSRDLAHAKVYYSVLGADVAIIGERLSHASSFLRHELGHSLRLRAVPELSFVHDTSIEEGDRLESLIMDAVARDEAAHPGDNED